MDTAESSVSAATARFESGYRALWCASRLTTTEAWREDSSGGFSLRTSKLFTNRLPDDFRVPLVMLAVEGLTIPEIAAILEIPQGTVKSRIFYARKRLKEKLKSKRKKR